MNAQVKAKWVDALRSGEYIQVSGALRKDVGIVPETRYCCLGVLCDLAHKEGKTISNWRRAEPDEDYFQIDNADAMIPDSVAEWAELRDADPKIPSQGNLSVSKLNDNEGKTFLEIADFIEKEL